MITLKLKRRDCFAVSLFGKTHSIRFNYSEEDTRRMRQPGGAKKDYKPVSYAWDVESPRVHIWTCPNETHLAMVMSYVLSSDRHVGTDLPHLDSRDTGGFPGTVLTYAVDHVLDLEDAILSALRGVVEERRLQEYLESARRFQVKILDRIQDPGSVGIKE